MHRPDHGFHIFFFNDGIIVQQRDMGREVSGGLAHLALQDMFTEKVLWKHELSSGSRLWPISHDEVGVMDRKGEAFPLYFWLRRVEAAS